MTTRYGLQARRAVTLSLTLTLTGTAGYWALVALNVPVLGYLTRLAGLHLLKRHQRLMIMGYEYAEGDVAWDGDKVRGSGLGLGLGFGFGFGLGLAEGDVAWDGDKVNATRTPVRTPARTLTLALPLTPTRTLPR